MKKTIKNFAEEKVFIIDNSKYLKYLGIILIILNIPTSFFKGLAAELIKKHITVKDIELIISYNISIEIFLIVLFTLILGEIFKIATEMAEENKFTI